MLRVRVCAEHMGGFLGLKFSKQGLVLGIFSITRVGLADIGIHTAREKDNGGEKCLRFSYRACRKARRIGHLLSS